MRQEPSHIKRQQLPRKSSVMKIEDRRAREQRILKELLYSQVASNILNLYRIPGLQRIPDWLLPVGAWAYRLYGPDSLPENFEELHPTLKEAIKEAIVGNYMFLEMFLMAHESD